MVGLALACSTPAKVQNRVNTMPCSEYQSTIENCTCDDEAGTVVTMETPSCTQLGFEFAFCNCVSGDQSPPQE